MSARKNGLGQPIGEPLTDWTPPRPPERRPLVGRYCRLEPLEPARHAGALHRANSLDAEGRIWTYMPYGPFPDLDSYRAWADSAVARDDPLFYAILPLGTEEASGVASFLRIDAANGVIEVGHINYAPPLQRTRSASEAMYLMMRYVFDELGYRRYEWKCDALNAASCAAARRLSFTYEGTFRQATIYKSRNRDTAWFSIVDREWPTIRAGFEAWLSEANFDAGGRQRRRLQELMAEAVERRAGAS